MRYLLALLVFILAANRGYSQKTEFEGLKKVNGVDLYFKVVGAGEPLLIVHGGPAMNHDYLLPHLMPLAKTHKLIFFDQRASGRSAIPDDSSKSISHRIMVDDIEAIRKEFGLKKLDIFAHSWGAKLAVNYAMRYRDKVGKLILSNPITFNHEYDSIQLANINNKTTVYNAAKRKELVGSKAFQEADLGVYEQLLRITYKTSFFDTANVPRLDIILAKDFFRQNASLMKGLSKDMEQYDIDYYPYLSEMKAKVLILHGKADNIPVIAAERLLASISNAKLVAFDSSGHFPFIEENNKFTQEVNAFLR